MEGIHLAHWCFVFQYADLGKLTFPGKKTFHNMERTVLEKRMKMLNDYLQILLQRGVIDTHSQLQRMLLVFFEQEEYDKGVTGGQIARTVTAAHPKPSTNNPGTAVLVTSTFVGAFTKLQKPTISFIMSVCLSIRLPAWNNSAPTRRIFVKFCLNIF
jgi:hypothetical protein